MARFNSGGSQVTLRTTGRFRAGVPATSNNPQPQQRVDLALQQRQQLQEKINEQIQKRNLLNAQAQANNPENAPIVSRTKARQLQVELGGLNESIAFLQQSLAGLGEGQAYADLNQVLQVSEQIGQQAREEQQAKISRGITNRKEREAQKEASIKEGFTQNPDGSFKTYGVTFNKEGTQILAMDSNSRVNLTPSQVLQINTKDFYNKVLSTKQTNTQENTPQEQPSKLNNNLLSYALLLSRTKPSEVAFAIEKKSIEKAKPIIEIASKSYNAFIDILPKLDKNNPLNYRTTPVISKNQSKEFSAIDIPNYITDKGADYTLKLGDIVAKGYTKIGVIPESISNVPSPLSYSQAKDIIKTAYIFTLFQPAMATSTTDITALNRVYNIPLRNVATPSVEEVSAIRITNGVSQKITDYKITQEVRPPILRVNVAEDSVRVIPPKYQYTSPLSPIVNNQPYLAVTYKAGGSVVKLNYIEGVTAKIDTEIVGSQLSKIQRYTLRGLLQETRGTINLNVIKNEATSKFYASELKSTKFTQINLEKMEYSPYGQLGKKTNTFASISEVKPFIETPELEIFRTDTFFRKANFPTSRVSRRIDELTGNLGELKGNLIVKKEPFVLDTEFTSYNLGSISGKTQELDLSNLLKTPVNKPFNVVKETSKPFVLETPKSDSFKLSISTSQEFKPLEKVETKNKESIKVASKSIQESLSQSLQLSGLRLESKSSSKLENKQSPSNKNIPKLDFKSFLDVGQASITQPKSAINQRGRFGNPASPISPPLPPSRPKEEPLKKPQRLFIPEIRNKPLDLSLKNFSVFLRRGGIFRPIASNVTKEQAFKIGTTAVNSTLGATFKIKGLGEFGTPKNYYKKNDKKEGALFIQRRRYRLSSIGEISEITMARKKRKIFR